MNIGTVTVLQQVVRGRITVKGVTDVLKIFQHHYGKFLHGKTRIPSSWYTVRKLATKGEVPPCDLRDVCPGCDFIFPRSPNCDPTCTRCGKETRWHGLKVGEAARQAAYFDIEHDFRKFFEVEVMVDALEEFATKEAAQGTIRNRQLNTAVDGSIVHDLHLHANAQQEDAVTSDEEAAEVEDDEIRDEGGELSNSDISACGQSRDSTSSSDEEGEEGKVHVLH